ncbi:MAG: class I SAM-dependent methyltransferase [Clostridia bacterium]|nr:class I SAM-dependent methyltransferase [Clostridia bacterium]
MNRQYSAFAHTYDKMMHDVDRDAWIAYLDGFLKEHGAHDIMDCACGTGANAIRLFKLGYHVTGNDVSPDMLMEARNNAFREGAKRITFICEDMRKLKIHKEIDAIVCVCDGVNYLTSMKDVESFFHHAATCLKPGGLLLFDISSAYKFREILATNTYTEETDDYAYIWKNNYDPGSRLCEMSLTCFVKQGVHYDRFHETHLMRAHAEEELDAALKNAGFANIQKYDAFTRDPVKPDSERIQYAAVKEETR